ncbi:hypothetical protein ACCT18_01270 [Rhizobium ruizarguesonis]
MDALMEGRWALMKQWGKLREIGEDRIFLCDLQAGSENLDENVVALGWVRDRLKRAIIDTPPEGGKLDAVWHHKRGWIHPVDEIRKAAAAVEAGKITRDEVADAPGVDLVEVDAENARDQERLKVNSWTTIPGGFEITFAEPNAFPFWNDMETQSDGLLERPDGYRLQICRIRRTREGAYKLGFTGPFRDMFRLSFRKLHPDLDAAKTAAEEIFRCGLERHGLALAS